SFVYNQLLFCEKTTLTDHVVSSTYPACKKLKLCIVSSHSSTRLARMIF
ncbi:unnamed protein product, partial [Amoebophrya sp. A25]